MGKTNEYEFTVDGLPVGKQRPRATIIGGHAKIYTPKKTVSYEALVRSSFLSKYRKGLQQITNGYVKVEINVYYQLEKPHFIKHGINSEGHKKLSGEILPTKKPDVDNIAKTILDALNGVIYRDDAQVIELVVKKSYIENLTYVRVKIVTYDYNETENQ